MHKMPVRTKDIKLDGDYEGFECTVKTSIPMTVFTLIQTGQWVLIQEALKQIIIKWNFTDEEGEPLPQPGETVDLKDAAGKTITRQETDEDGNMATVPIQAPGVAFIPPELGMLIVNKLSENIMDVSPS